MAEEVKEKAETKEKLVKVRLPLIPNVEKQEAQFVSCNGRDFVIPRGKEVEVPECIAEILRNSEEAQMEAFLYDSKHVKS